MNRLLIPILILALLGGGAWVLMSGDAAEGTKGEETGLGGAVSHGETGDLDSPADMHAEGLSRQEAADGNEGEVASSASQVRIRFVHAETGEALPDLRFHHLEPAPRESFPPREIHDLIEARGTAGRTDALGNAAVPAPERFAFILVREPGLFTRHVLRTLDEETHTVKVSTEESMTVEVVDADGAPASGILVRYFSYRTEADAFGLVEDRTDAHGIAKLEQLQFYDPIKQAGVRRGVGLALPGVDPPIQHFLREETPAHLRFQLPPTATVHLRAFRHDGSSFPDGTEVSLQATDMGDLGTLFRDRSFQEDLLMGHDRRPLSGGKASFQVALHQELRFGLHLPHHRHSVIDEAPGPTRAGEEMDLELRLEEAPCWVVGRMLDGNGDPLREVFHNGRLHTHDGSGPLTFDTDMDGNFRIPIESRQVRSPYDEEDDEAYRRIIFRAEPQDGIALVGTIVLDRDLEPGENSVGDIRLETDLLLQGQVVDAQGMGVPRARIIAKWHANAGDAFRGKKVGAPFGTTRTFRTDAEGRFEVRSAEPAGLMMLNVQAKGFLNQSLAMDPGQSDVRIVMEGQTLNSVRVTLPEGMSTEQLRIVMLRDNGADSWKNTIWFRDGVGSMERLASGTYLLEARLRGSHTLLESVPDVIVQPGSPQDPRLDPLDLRARITMMDLEVLGTDGLPVESYSYALAEKSINDWQGIRDAIFPVPSSMETIEVWTEDSLRETIPVRAGRQEVRLRAARSLVVRIGEDFQLQESESLLLRAKIPGTESQDLPVRPGMELTLHYHDAGTLELSMFSLTERDGGTFFAWLLADGRGTVKIEVGEDGSVEPVELAISRPD